MKNHLQNAWRFADVWNASLEERAEREMKIRDNVWASELGRAPIDVWLKMRATPFTNPPNARSLRKFEAGNVFEWIVSLILKRAGILQESQKWSSYQYEGLIEVTGKADFIAGGKPDIEKWKSESRSLGLPDVFLRVGDSILEYFEKNYPDGLAIMPLEIKSVSAFMFEALERNQQSSKIHRMQLFHYLKSDNHPFGSIVYICRDDLRIIEFLVENPSDTEQEYKNTIEILSAYHQENKQPPLEQPIVFDEDIGKFAKNFNVAYSPYLKMLYGFNDQNAFDNVYQPKVARWNRVMCRIRDGKNMTKLNEEVKQEITDAGFNIDELIPKFVPNKDEEDNL